MHIEEDLALLLQKLCNTQLTSHTHTLTEDLHSTKEMQPTRVYYGLLVILLIVLLVCGFRSTGLILQSVRRLQKDIQVDSVILCECVTSEDTGAIKIKLLEVH